MSCYPRFSCKTFCSTKIQLLLDYLILCFRDLSAWELFVVNERLWASYCLEGSQENNETGSTRSGISVWNQKGGGCSWSNVCGVTQRIWTTLRIVLQSLQGLLGSRSKDRRQKKYLALASLHHVWWGGHLLDGNRAPRLSTELHIYARQWEWLLNLDD